MLEVATLELNEQLTSLLVTLLRIISIDSTSSATVFCMSEISILSRRIYKSPSMVFARFCHRSVVSTKTVCVSK